MNEEKPFKHKRTLHKTSKYPRDDEPLSKEEMDLILAWHGEWLPVSDKQLAKILGRQVKTMKTLRARYNEILKKRFGKKLRQLHEAGQAMEEYFKLDKKSARWHLEALKAIAAEFSATMALSKPDKRTEE
jgi:hypothetical protein